jgi:hypothetical protein
VLVKHGGLSYHDLDDMPGEERKEWFKLMAEEAEESKKSQGPTGLPPGVPSLKK